MSELRSAALVAALSMAMSWGAGLAEPNSPQPNSGDDATIWQSLPDARVHLQSGMKCPLYVEGLDTQIDPTHAQKHYLPLRSLSTSAPGRPSGDDVACNYGDAEGREAVASVTRLKPDEKAAAVFDATVKLINESMPDATTVMFDHGDYFVPGFGIASSSHRAQAAAWRLKVSGREATLVVFVDDVHGWALQFQMLDFTTTPRELLTKGGVYWEMLMRSMVPSGRDWWHRPD